MHSRNYHSKDLDPEISVFLWFLFHNYYRNFVIFSEFDDVIKWLWFMKILNSQTHKYSAEDCFEGLGFKILVSFMVLNPH